MRTQTNSTLYGYWNGMRGGRIAPQRFEIEPSQIAGILSETFILEFASPSNFNYRLAGTRICEITGREMRGINFLDCWRDSDRVSLQRHLTSVRKLGAVARALIEGTSTEAKSAQFEVLILPLLHNGNSIDRFLGAMSPINPPPWLGACPIREFHVLETELTYPADDIDVAEQVVKTDSPPEPLPMPSFRSARIVRHDRRQFRVYEGGLSSPREES